MAFPQHRIRTYVPLSQIPPSDLNAFQDAAIDHETRIGSIEQFALYEIALGTTAEPANLGGLAWTDGATLVDGNKVQLPSGRWWASAKVEARSSDNSNPVDFTLALKVGATTIERDVRTRWNTDTARRVHLAVVTPLLIEDPENERVTVEVTASAGTVTIGTTGPLQKLSFHRFR